MAEVKKQERDFTPETDNSIAESTSLAKEGKLQQAIDKLLILEKQTRNASDLKSTTRLASTVLGLAFEARDYDALNTNLNLLNKKHGQFKATVQSMVEQVMEWLEEIKSREGTERWLELVNTLRAVSEGKIFLETPRARITRSLSQYHEALANSPTSPSPSPKESLQTASDLMSELLVETYSSMDRREKTEFLLEQIRLLEALATLKDAEADKEGKDSLRGGEGDWIKVRGGSRKVSEAFLKQEENEDLKFKYYELMIKYALYNNDYLDVAQHYHKIWETPSVKGDESGKGRTVLEHVVYYVILAPHGNEQSDMLHRVFNYPELAKMTPQYNFVKCFTTKELMRWPNITGIYEAMLRATDVFDVSAKKRWDDLHTRVVEHNIRVVAEYYTRITLSRLMQLLDLSKQETEETVSRLVVSKTIWARIDRPAGIVKFRNARNAEEVMNDWSSDMQRLLGLVEKAWMGMNAAQAAQSRVKA